MSIKDAKVQRFGEKLRTLRQKRNMTHVELAAQLGYASSSQISLLENGKTKPTADLIFKVSRFFNVSADDLVDDGREV
jgi:transcriptional regulator with XRE-family HTH domain